MEDLKAAQAAIEQAWACKDARALGRMRRLAEAETASYEKEAAPAREPSPDENPSGRRRRRAAPTNLAELDPSPRPLQKRKGSTKVIGSAIMGMHPHKFLPILSFWWDCCRHGFDPRFVKF